MLLKPVRRNPQPQNSLFIEKTASTADATAKTLQKTTQEEVDMKAQAYQRAGVKNTQVPINHYVKKNHFAAKNQEPKQVTLTQQALKMIGESKAKRGTPHFR